MKKFFNLWLACLIALGFLGSLGCERTNDNIADIENYPTDDILNGHTGDIEGGHTGDIEGGHTG